MLPHTVTAAVVAPHRSPGDIEALLLPVDLALYVLAVHHIDPYLDTLTHITISDRRQILSLSLILLI